MESLNSSALDTSSQNASVRLQTNSAVVKESTIDRPNDSMAGGDGVLDAYDCSVQVDLTTEQALAHCAPIFKRCGSFHDTEFSSKNYDEILKQTALAILQAEPDQLFIVAKAMIPRAAWENESQTKELKELLGFAHVVRYSKSPLMSEAYRRVAGQVLDLLCQHDDAMVRVFADITKNPPRPPRLRMFCMGLLGNIVWIVLSVVIMAIVRYVLHGK